MNERIVTVRHGPEGIRFAWPAGTTTTFSNQVLLAESFARAKTHMAVASEAITKTAADEIDRIEFSLNQLNSELPSELTENEDTAFNQMVLHIRRLREVLLEAARTLT